MITIHAEDCWMVATVRRLGRDYGWKTTDWRRIARNMVVARGCTITVWRCDDTMIEFYRDGDRIRQKSHRPGTWRFSQ
jgi:hypothetical protein